MTLSSAELAHLAELRQHFLNPTPGGRGYWRSLEEVALYDRTFAERIGWKWDAVLQELTTRGWSPPSGTLVDFGCGSGIAGRRVLAHWPGNFTKLVLNDHSALARNFAASAASRACPGLQLDIQDVGSKELPTGSTVVLSHVLNEMDDQQVRGLVRALERNAAAIIWVESATHENSRRLIQVLREPLLAAASFSVVAPCTHAARCGMLAPKNERHWCHSFAPPPPEIFQDSGWMEWSRTLGIDLRSIPYSFLVLQREPAPALPTHAARVIGRPRDYKGYSKILSCEITGVHERMLQKRDAPHLLKEIQNGRRIPIYAWKLTDAKISGGAPVYESETK